jgi:hypothetical protein
MTDSWEAITRQRGEEDDVVGIEALLAWSKE